MLRYLAAGESHGPCLTAIIEGLPAHVPIVTEEINQMLRRRQGGYGRGGRMKIEKDKVQITSGVRHGLTIGSPVTLTVANKDWENWSEIMSPDKVEEFQNKEIKRPRPGHADLPGGIKYGHRDMRNVLERSSARETAVRVAVGAVAKQLLDQLGVTVVSHVLQIGSAKVTQPVEAVRMDQVLASPVYCADSGAERKMMAAIDAAKEQGDSLGGIFAVHVSGMPTGIGSNVHWDRRLDGRLAQALMSLQAIKGVEVGLGFAAAALPGSQVHDEIAYDKKHGYYRRTNRAGGLEGGISNGEELIIKAAMKPIPTLMKPLGSVNIESKETVMADIERSDVCAVPAASVVGEALVAFELAKAVLEQFGGDNMAVIKERWQQWKEYIEEY